MIGDNDANISTLQMLTSIENMLGTLLDLQETLPEDTIAEFEKKLEKDRRARLREEKIREQEALQKERVKRALERAQGKPFKVLDIPITVFSRTKIPSRTQTRTPIRTAQSEREEAKEQGTWFYIFSIITFSKVLFYIIP